MDLFLVIGFFGGLIVAVVGYVKLMDYSGDWISLKEIFDVYFSRSLLFSLLNSEAKTSIIMVVYGVISAALSMLIMIIAAIVHAANKK